MKKLFLIIPAIIIAAIIAFILYLKFALPNVGPAPDIKVEITKERLERGEYLATSVMGCIDCHTHRDFTKFSGPLNGNLFAGGSEEFIEEHGAPGNFYAPNITPYHLKDWTDGEIYRAITTGVAKDGRALYPVMPYKLHGQASKEDIYAVIAYLRTLPSHENTAKTSKATFPFSLIMNTIPSRMEHKEMPDKNNLVAYGEYVANLAACIDCHTPMVKGKFILEEAYSGGFEFMLPTGTVRSSNITPDKETGIGSWTEEMFVDRFKMYSDSAYIAPSIKDGFNTIMPWTVYANMKEHDLKALFAYLQTLEPQKKVMVKFTPNNN